MTEPELLTEVPAALKRLAKQVVRGFYGVEHALALDVLIRNPCVREEDMLELLKFDRKQLRSVLNTLKGDKFVKCRMRVETAPDGKTTRHNYYFINYRLLVNVVKYKLDHMRRRIETDERDSTNRASFRCPCCLSTFTDLEANQLFDPMTGTFRCTFCQTEVEEDESVVPKKDARTLVARFNEQIEPIYVLLRETEDVNLSHDLLEPEPAEIPALKQSRERAAASGGTSAGGPHREAWSNKGSSYADLYTQNVVINMEEQDEQRSKAGEAKAARERPVWLTQSTVQGAYSEPDALNNSADFTPGVQDGADSQGIGHSDENEEVMRALLIHEKRSTAGSGAGGASAAARALGSATGNASDSESDTSESDDDSPHAPPPAVAAQHRGEEEEEEEEDEFEEVGDEPMVMVGGRPFSYREVSQRPELVEQMSAQEKDAYIVMGTNLFQDIYF
ncbi:general transcription factor IIE subunit 1 [Myripristis murdjan]|uniref:General transcription factor IIE subunit 1 n=1 Tax=Myripristis murdjan TaxID=586833 RepID=A0A667ZIY7_9TELE|nr:general transcription factor IIE subunit 1 [Myripristis murdjan]XP_029936294.1 general transcription factor IIE subunit 1 [Myripristis murdjan]XP_029936295.1 general transcription factor IIE subunit 1 [Myripristis murdjan]XP_029936296.1 general transcription factor IIE subunit 1 [Myripristis murdjan]XP_029936297.1 general transcription factor IIE subunit 1 [Myripristis murdjan]XP_029936298.1 general transcription factor IIE subunit 1 [Myripristis murdjan]